MARTLLTQFKRRRRNRWLRREALLLARESELFDCPFMRKEAEELLALTGGFGS